MEALNPRWYATLVIAVLLGPVVAPVAGHGVAGSSRRESDDLWIPLYMEDFKIELHFYAYPFVEDRAVKYDIYPLTNSSPVDTITPQLFDPAAGRFDGLDFILANENQDVRRGQLDLERGAYLMNISTTGPEAVDDFVWFNFTVEKAPFALPLWASILIGAAPMIVFVLIFLPLIRTRPELDEEE